MRKQIILAFSLLVALLCICFALFYTGYRYGIRKQAGTGDCTVVTESVLTYDTVLIKKPVPVDSTVIRYLSISVPAVDNSENKDGTMVSRTDTFIERQEIYITRETSEDDEPPNDSIKVNIPITQKHYSDSTYEAWVSGYSPVLDSIRVTNKNTYTREIVYPKAKRWGLGIHGGVGYSPKGFQPYIGIGISYNFWQF